MASLATGSANFPNQISENPPQLIEDLARSMLDFDGKPEIAGICGQYGRQPAFPAEARALLGLAAH